MQNYKKLFVISLDAVIGKTESEDIKKVIEWFDNNDYLYCFYTNDSSKTKKEHSVEIKEMTNITILPKDIVSSYEILMDDLIRNEIKNILLLSTKSIRQEFKKYFNVSSPNPEAVVITNDTSFNYNKLKSIVNVLSNNLVKYYATHEDSVKIIDNKKYPDVLCIQEYIYNCVFRSPTTFGKPSSNVIKYIMDRNQFFDFENTYMIGDSIYQDFGMALRTGIVPVLLLNNKNENNDISSIKGKTNKLLVTQNFRSLPIIIIKSDKNRLSDTQ